MYKRQEYEWLKESATEISNIENKLTELEEKYPEIMQKSMDGDMSMPAGSDMSNPPDDGSPIYFRFYLGNNSIVVVCIGTFFIGNQLMPSVKMQKW